MSSLPSLGEAASFHDTDKPHKQHSDRLMPIHLEDRPRPETLAWMYSLAAALVPINAGYNSGVMSGSIDAITSDLSLSSTQAALVVAMMNLTAAAGGLVSGWLGDLAGRKGAIAVASVLCIVGVSITVFADSYAEMIWGRAITGLGCGCGFVQAPLYTAEIVPPDMRGRMVALQDISINTGILLGYVVAWLVTVEVVNTSVSWRYMLAVGLVLPVLIIGALLFIPESPRWLVLAGYTRAAQNVLAKVSHSEAEVEETLAGMQKLIQQEQGGGTYAQIFWPREAYVKHAILLVVGAGVVQQIVGSETVVYYSPDILEAAGLASTNTALGVTIAVGVSKIIGDVTAALLLDAWGRRPIMLTSSYAVLTAVIALGFSLLFGAPWGFILFVLCLFMAAFSFGLGCVTFLVCNELMPLKLRSKAVGIALGLNRLLSALTILFFRSLATSTYIMALMYLCVFSVGALLTSTFYQLLLPETANKTLEEIQMEIADAVVGSSGRGYDTIA